MEAAQLRCRGLPRAVARSTLEWRKEGGRRKDEGRIIESILVGAVPHAVALVVGFSSFIHSFIRSIKLNAYLCLTSLKSLGCGGAIKRRTNTKYQKPINLLK